MSVSALEEPPSRVLPDALRVIGDQLIRQTGVSEQLGARHQVTIRIGRFGVSLITVASVERQARLRVLASWYVRVTPPQHATEHFITWNRSCGCIQISSGPSCVRSLPNRPRWGRAGRPTAVFFSGRSRTSSGMRRRNARLADGLASRCPPKAPRIRRATTRGCSERRGRLSSAATHSSERWPCKTKLTND